MSGAYEREAIRPHVLGGFTDMLLAVEGHPAMLFFFSTISGRWARTRSRASTAPAASTRISRETMELHTLAWRSGYTQDDVIGFANVLTGWTLLPAADNPEHGGEFSFNPRLHEPGAQTVLGKSYAEDGAEQGRAVLRDLAAHPATATHLATRLATHFIADVPPPALVERMTKVFRDTSGDLKETAKAMVASPEAWSEPRTKLKRPSEWVVLHGARHRNYPSESQAVHRWADVARRAPLAPVLAQGISGRRSLLDRRHGSAARHRQQFRRARVGPGRSAGRRRERAGIAGLARGEAGGRPCREPPAGARAAVHVSRIAEEVTMTFAICQARREALLGAGTLFAWSQMPKLARAEGRDPRLLVIVLRARLTASAPWGRSAIPTGLGSAVTARWCSTARRPHCRWIPSSRSIPRCRTCIGCSRRSKPPSCTRPRLHIATARISTGQDVLESGIARPGAVDSGWLNRALVALASDGRVDPRGSRALGVGAVTPPIVRGKAPVMSWVPQQLLPASDDTQARLMDLYQHTDPKLAVALEARMRMTALGGVTTVTADPTSDDPSLPLPGIARVRAYAAEVAGSAARFLSKPDGPRVGAASFVGWDTHINEGAVTGQLANLLGVLDGALAAIETNMGDTWRETVVAVITEFGRTARINGTNGTDHGQGTVALSRRRCATRWPHDCRLAGPEDRAAL